MERADLLYSGLMFAAGMLSALDRVLLTAAFVAPRTLARENPHPPLLQFHLQKVTIRPIVLQQIMVPKNLRPLVPYLKRYRSGLVWGGALRLIQ